MWSVPDAARLSDDDRRTLEAWVRARSTPQKVVFRSQIILLAAEGLSNRRIAQQLNTSRPTVILWRNRSAARGPAALTEEEPGRGRKQQLPTHKVKQIVEATLHSHPSDATHWSVRSMAAAQGVSPATVQRIWDAHGLQPHRTETFKLSRDKRFVEKLTDVVGLYLNPPERALVLCFDEKSQIQALDRTQPGLPMKKGRCGTLTHDYKRLEPPPYSPLSMCWTARLSANAWRGIVIKNS
jgi:transposase